MSSFSVHMEGLFCPLLGWFYYSGVYSKKYLVVWAQCTFQIYLGFLTATKPKKFIELLQQYYYELFMFGDKVFLFCNFTHVISKKVYDQGLLEEASILNKWPPIKLSVSGCLADVVLGVLLGFRKLIFIYLAVIIWLLIFKLSN